MSMKNSSDTIGKRSRDLPVCSAVPTAQPLRHRVPHFTFTFGTIFTLFVPLIHMLIVHIQLSLTP
jgi:hypothetical protein